MENITYASFTTTEAFKAYVFNFGRKVDVNVFVLKNYGRFELLHPFLISYNKATEDEKKSLVTVVICKKKFLIKENVKLKANQQRIRMRIAEKHNQKAMKRHKLDKDVFIPVDVVIKMFGEKAIVKHNIREMVKKDGSFYVSLLYLVQKMKSGARCFLKPGLPKEAEEYLINEFPYLLETV